MVILRKSKKEKRRDRRNNNDYYGNDAYDDYGYGGREGAFEDYSDQDEDYYALDSIDDPRERTIINPNPRNLQVLNRFKQIQAFLALVA